MKISAMHFYHMSAPALRESVEEADRVEIVMALPDSVSIQRADME